MIDVTAGNEVTNDARARGNVLRLAAAQALTGANGSVIFATGSIIGATLAPDISLATVPLSMFVLGMAAGTLPTGAISRAYGRRVAFIIGTGCGMLTGLLGAFAILHASFPLFCCATFLGGLYGSVSQSYRFAAADGASAAFRPKAVSLVMAGGVFAGVLGPQLVQWTMDLWQPYLFAFSFVVQAVVALIATGLLHFLLQTTPRATQFFGWIMGLLIVVAMVIPLSLVTDTDDKVATALLNLLIGLAITIPLTNVAYYVSRPRAAAPVATSARRDEMPPTRQWDA